MNTRISFEEKIHPKHTGLVIVDIQNDFCSPSGIAASRGRDLSMIEHMIDTLIPFLKDAEDLGIKTYYIKQEYNREHLNGRQKEQYDLDGKLAMCDPQTTGADFYRIQPKQEQVYVKYNFDAYSNTELLKMWDQDNISTLLFAGVDTQYCVSDSLHHAYNLGFKVVLLTDLVATNAKHQDEHDMVIKLMRTYGATSTSREVLSIWKKQQ